MSIDHVVLDIEIANPVEETPGGWDATDKLGIGVACLWEARTRRMRVYGPEDVEALRNRLEVAQRISGFNIVNFDLAVIWGMRRDAWIASHTRSGVASRCNDLLRRIWISQGLHPDVFTDRHKGYSLNAVAHSTLGGVQKIGDGADAPRWYRQGLIQRVANYCADDVAIERDLAEFVDRYGYVRVGHRVITITAQEGC